MRTTLNIDDDVLVAAKELAKRERKSTGAFMSDLIRDALANRSNQASREGPGHASYGFRPIPKGGRVVTDKDVNDLRDELGI